MFSILTLLDHTFIILFHCHFSGHFNIRSSKNFCHYQPRTALFFFLFRVFYKYPKSCLSEGAIFGSYADCIRSYQSRCNNLLHHKTIYFIIKKCGIELYLDRIFLNLIPGAFIYNIYIFILSIYIYIYIYIYIN